MTGTFTGAGADLDVFINEVWSSKINDFAKEKMHFANFFINRSDELSGGGDTIHTGNLTEMSGNTKNNAAAVTLKCWGQNLTIQLKQSIIEVFNIILCKQNVSVVGAY